MNWQRLADEVVRRRTHLGYATRAEFATATGFAPKTLSDLEKLRRDNFDRVTLARLEKALQWPEGRVEEILSQPIVAHSMGMAVVHAPPSGIAARVMPPTAVKVAWLVGDDSPLEDRDRRNLEAALNKVIEVWWPPTVGPD